MYNCSGIQPLLQLLVPPFTFFFVSKKMHFDPCFPLLFLYKVSKEQINRVWANINAITDGFGVSKDELRQSFAEIEDLAPGKLYDFFDSHHTGLVPLFEIFIPLILGSGERFNDLSRNKDPSLSNPFLQSTYIFFF